MIKLFLSINLVAALTLLFPIQSYAAGPYDGIYSVTLRYTNYVSIRENTDNNQIVAILLGGEPSENTWSAFTGIRTENSVTLDTLRGVSDDDTVAKAKVVFDNNGNATVTILSCTDGVYYYCAYPAGISFTAQKIF